MQLNTSTRALLIFALLLTVPVMGLPQTKRPSLNKTAAAIGLVLGGAAGVGSLAVKGSKELRLESGTEMLIHLTK